VRTRDFFAERLVGRKRQTFADKILHTVVIPV
jgi:hypothetical protein